jgi:hypothetical protein
VFSTFIKNRTAITATPTSRRDDECGSPFLLDFRQESGLFGRKGIGKKRKKRMFNKTNGRNPVR